jgi:hypothetical protein
VVNCPKRYFIDPELGPVFMETDASDYAIGSYVYQKDTEAKHLPIAFGSHTLNDVQRRWATNEKEQYAIFRGFIDNEHLLRGHPIVVRTDHKNLLMSKDTHGKIARWKMAIDSFDYRIEYVKGKENAVADCLSRLAETTFLGALRQRGILSEEARRKISQYHNEYTGHRGAERTLELLIQYGETWKGMRRDVRQFIRECPFCQKMSQIKEVIVTNPFTMSASRPMDLISLDSIGPIDEGVGKKQHILVVIDNFTRFVELYSLESVTALEAAKCLIDWIGRYSTPSKICTDKGSQFENELIDYVTKSLNIDRSDIAPGSKEENSLVERANKEVMRHLRALVFSTGVPYHWPDQLPLVQRIMNASRHGSIGTKPATLLFGNAIDLDRSYFLRRLVKDGVEQQLKDIQARSYVDNLLKSQQILIEAADRLQSELDDEHLEERNRGESTQFRPGSYVLVSYANSIVGNRPPSKFNTKWRGPLRVISQEGNHVTLEELPTGKMEKHTIKDVQPFHVGGQTEEELRILAARDRNEIAVEEILSHRGHDPTRPSITGPVEFKVKWLGLPFEQSSWEPYKSLRHAEQLHKYLREHGLEVLIPKEYREKKGGKRSASAPVSADLAPPTQQPDKPVAPRPRQTAKRKRQATPTPEAGRGKKAATKRTSAPQLRKRPRKS